MSIDLYQFPGSPPCRAVLLAGAAYGIKFELKTIDLFKKEQLGPDFIKINPRHTLPTIVDNGFVLGESRAIIQYFANAYSKNDSLYPKQPKQRAVVDQMLLFDMGALNKSMTEAYVPTLFGAGPVVPEKVKVVDSHLVYLEEVLTETKFSAANQLTIADFSIITTLTTLDACGHKFSKYPSVSAYMARCKTDIKGYNDIEQKAYVQIKGLWKTATTPAS